MKFFFFLTNLARRVNENFAQAVLKALRRINKEKADQIPIVWIHDYHLMLAANTIRQVRSIINNFSSNHYQNFEIQSAHFSSRTLKMST